MNPYVIGAALAAIALILADGQDREPEPRPGKEPSREPSRERGDVHVHIHGRDSATGDGLPVPDDATEPADESGSDSPEEDTDG